jgi:hypothetical protein
MDEMPWRVSYMEMAPMFREGRAKSFMRWLPPMAPVQYCRVLSIDPDDPEVTTARFYMRNEARDQWVWVEPEDWMFAAIGEWAMSVGGV